MSIIPDEPRGTARLPLQLSQERGALQQALLGSIRLFKGDVLRFAHDWQARWTNPAITQQLAEISEALLTDLAGLEQELSRPEGPASARVAGLLAMLLGEPGVAGPLARLQQVAEDESPGLSLEKQRLLSEVDTLFIQLNGFRAQWQDYLSLLPASGRASSSDPTEPMLPPLPPNQRARHATEPLSPLRRPASPRAYPGMYEPPILPPPILPPPVSASPRAWQSGGLGDMLKALLPILLALIVIVFVAVEVVSRVPKSSGQTTPGSSTSATQSTQPVQPTATSAPASTATPSPQPASAQLSVSPSSLQLPCPASGASQLQVANTGDTALDWQAAAASAAGGDPGILLDGANPDGGHLNPGEATQISVTAQAASAQGAITITATGGANSVTVPYSVNC
ncbi:MAG TPA: hypothetical protein VFU69_07350 [Ktedonobacterales bacterium]|nr:hypothetical protein [Ktedonobacterales bacterium]